MGLSKPNTKDWLKRKINAAKAEKGLKWRQIADELSSRGKTVSASSLMSKHSRSSFTAVELLSLLQILEVQALEVPSERRVRRQGRHGSMVFRVPGSGK